MKINMSQAGGTKKILKIIRNCLDTDVEYSYFIQMRQATDLKELRCSRKMTLAEMAEQLGVSIGYVGHLETGFRKLNDDLVKRFADILNVSQKAIREATEQIEKKNALANSWLTHIKINGFPLMDAFKYHAATTDSEFDNRAKVRDQIVKFVTKNLPFSVMAEISSNEQLLDEVIEHCRD